MKSLLLLFLLFLPFSFLSQNADVSGIVQDINGDPLPFATVILYSAADSTMVKGDVSGESGTFYLPGLSSGNYWLQIQSVGYETYHSEVFALSEGENKTMPKTMLNESSVQLEGVEVQAQRALIEMEPDKTVFNVEGSINATGNTALELLRKSPGVVVDNNDNIMLSGKSGVKVYIDGKPTYLSSEDLVNRLNAMQSNEIEAVEIITNPSAKYEAEGNAGIINIRLKKDQNLGYNATLNLGYAIGIFSKYNGSAMVNYRNQKMNAFGSYSYKTGLSRNWMNFHTLQGDLLMDDQSVTIRDGDHHSARAGMDVFLHPKHTLGFIVNGYHHNRNWDNTSHVPISNRHTGEPISVLDARSENDGIRKNLNTNLNYRFDNGKKVTWNIDLDWGVFRNNTETYQPNFYRDPFTGVIVNQRIFRSMSPTDIDIYTFKVDHERPLWKGALGAGVKLSNVITNNTYDYYNLINGQAILDVERSNNFVFRENINAAYMTYSRQAGNFLLNGGLRAEQTNSEGILTSKSSTGNAQVTVDDVDFFPSAGISWQQNSSHQWRLNYSRRINRPDYQDLNPFEYKLSEISYMRGNPFLRPQFSHSISISHIYKYFLNTSLGYTHTNDFFARITDSVDVNKSYLEPVNLDYQKGFNLTVSMPFSPFKWWSLYTSVSAFHTENYAADINGREVFVSVNAATVYHQSSFMLPKDYSLQVSGWYNSPSVWSGVMRTKSHYSIDVGMQKRLFNDRGILKVTVSDIFHTSPWSAVQEFPGYYVEGSGGWESRQLRINFSYVFGNDQVKNARDRKTGIENEMNRVKEE